MHLSTYNLHPSLHLRDRENKDTVTSMSSIGRLKTFVGTVSLIGSTLTTNPSYSGNPLMSTRYNSLVSYGRVRSVG